MYSLHPKVGVLKGRIFDASAATKSGANVVVGDQDELVPGVCELLQCLQDKKISGIILDKLTYISLLRDMRDIVKDEGSSSGVRINAKFFLEVKMYYEVRSAAKVANIYLQTGIHNMKHLFANDALDKVVKTRTSMHDNIMLTKRYIT